MMPSKFNPQKCKIFLIIILVLYGFSWLSSVFVWYETDSEYTFQHAPIKKNGVVYKIWMNPINTECNRNLLCPNFIKCDSVGPYAVIFRVSDLNHTAKKIKIHSAKLVMPDSSEKLLRFIDNKPSMSDNWYPFHKNASEWIVHLYQKERLEINQKFSIEVDISIEKEGVVKKESIILNLTPYKKTRSMLAFLTA